LGAHGKHLAEGCPKVSLKKRKIPGRKGEKRKTEELDPDTAFLGWRGRRRVLCNWRGASQVQGNSQKDFQLCVLAPHVRIAGKLGRPVRDVPRHLKSLFCSPSPIPLSRTRHLLRVMQPRVTPRENLPPAESRNQGGRFRRVGLR
jgi:hypothetical protein